MSARKAALFLFVLAGALAWSSAAWAQQCRWCDRLASHAKGYKYQYKPDTKPPESVVLDVSEVVYRSFKTPPVDHRDIAMEEVQDERALDITGNKEFEKGFRYFVCEYHHRLEEALAFAAGDKHWGKYKQDDVTGLKMRADVLADSATDTVLTYTSAGAVSEPTIYLVEIAHEGYAKATLEALLKEEIKARVFVEGEQAAFEKDFRDRNQASFRVLSYDLTQEFGKGTEAMPATAIEELGGGAKEIDVRDRGQAVMSLRFERAPRPSEDPKTFGEGEKYAQQRDAKHWFSKESRWLVRLGGDPLRHVLPRAKQYDAVKGAGSKNPDDVAGELAKALGEYADELLSDRKKLAAEDRVPKRVLSSELDDAQTHAQELRHIVFCQYNPSVPAVRIWKDYTDPEDPRTVALSPFNEGFKKYDDSVSGGFLYSYLTVVGVLIISSALSFVGIKSAGG